MTLCRRAEWFQHSPGVSLSRGGSLPKNDPRGAAHTGSQEHPGTGATPAVRRLHVHVPEPNYEPVQVESSPQTHTPPFLLSATPPHPLTGQKIPRKTKMTDWREAACQQGCGPEWTLSTPLLPNAWPSLEGAAMVERGRSLFALCISWSVVFFM